MLAYRRAVLLAVTLGLTASILACVQPVQDERSSPALTAPPPATEAPAAGAQPTREPAAAPGGAPTESPFRPVPGGGTYDPNRTMYGIWDGLGHDPGDSHAALEDTVFFNDKSQAYVILEALKFFNLDVARSALDTLTELTGQDFDFDRRQWREWIGAREERVRSPVRLRTMEGERPGDH